MRSEPFPSRYIKHFSTTRRFFWTRGGCMGMSYSHLPIFSPVKRGLINYPNKLAFQSSLPYSSLLFSSVLQLHLSFLCPSPWCFGCSSSKINWSLFAGILPFMRAPTHKMQDLHLRAEHKLIRSLSWSFRGTTTSGSGLATRPKCYHKWFGHGDLDIEATASPPHGALKECIQRSCAEWVGGLIAHDDRHVSL